MSQRVMLTAAILAVALSQTQASWISRYDQEQIAQIRKQKQQQQLQSFDEDEWQGSVGVSYGNQSGLGVNVGISHTWEEQQEQKIHIGKALKKAANVIVKANELGLLEEDEWGGEVYGEVGSQGGRRDWKVGGKITFDEEEAEQKFKLGKALKKAANVVVKAHEIGLFEEDEQIMDEEQKFKLGKALKKVANVVVKANELGLLDEDQDELQGIWGPVIKEVAKEVGKSVAVQVIVDGIKNGVHWVQNGFKDEDQDEEELQGGEIYGHIGRQGGKKDWQIGGKWTFDEQEPTTTTTTTKPTIKKPHFVRPHHPSPHHNNSTRPYPPRPHYPFKPTPTKPTQTTTPQDKPSKWTHNGFKPTFQKPSSLQFTKNEKF